MTKKIRQIHEDMKQMNGSVLSIYLNTNPGTEDWKIRLKNGLKKTAQYIAASNPEQVKQFSKIRNKVSVTIKNSQTSFTNSLICFASTDHLKIYHLQVPVENDFQWNVKPATEQLDSINKHFSKTGVILLQSDKVTLITSSLGELVHETHYELDLERENWKQYKGLAFGNIYASSANHRHKFNRRLKENQSRWYKEIAPTIERHAKQQKWKGVHLAGPADLTNDMKNLLNVDIIGETTRNYSGKSAHAVLDRTILAKLA